MFDALAALFGRRSSLSVPILDGALKPNNRLEDAPVLLAQDGLEDLALAPGGTLHCAFGSSVASIAVDGALTTRARYDAKVTALAILPDGTIAAGLGTSVSIGAGTAAARTIDAVDGKRLGAVTALTARPDGSLLICDASSAHPVTDWSRDLMERQRSGRLLAVDPAQGVATLADGLGHAFGALADGGGRLLVSESWRHQVSVVKSGRANPVLAALPGYPARMARAEGGGFWLSMFACRTQLVEFVLRETDYRREMMRTIDPKYWVAPAFSSGEDFLEPLQGGSVKQMGVLKPWAPPRSYGLVVRVSDDFIPQFSLHSRTGGRHHGIVAMAQRGDDLFVLSKGAGRILRVSLSGPERPAA